LISPDMATAANTDDMQMTHSVLNFTVYNALI